MRYPQLAELIQQGLREMSVRDRHDYTIREIAAKIDEPENSLQRWSKGLSVPQSPAAREKLAKVFGPAVWPAMGMLPPDIDPAFLRLYLGARKDPNLQRILDDAMERAQEYQKEQQPAGQLALTV